MELMLAALIERDQFVGLTACEFWTGLTKLAFSPEVIENEQQ